MNSARVCIMCRHDKHYDLQLTVSNGYNEKATVKRFADYAELIGYVNEYLALLDDCALIHTVMKQPGRHWRNVRRLKISEISWDCWPYK